MKVRIIPEDDENDLFILRPLFQSMFKHMGKPQAEVRIHHPRVSGWESVKKWEHIEEILDKFRFIRKERARGLKKVDMLTPPGVVSIVSEPGGQHVHQPVLPCLRHPWL